MSIRKAPTDTPPMMELSAVHRIYRTGRRAEVTALDGVDLRISDGEMVAVLGGPKSGTSTLLNILSCLDLPTAGRYRLGGTDVGRLSKRRRTKLRGRKVGFVFSSFDLMPEVTVQRNVELPMIYARQGTRRAVARQALRTVGLGGFYDDMPADLLELQRQRALIARALVNDPTILFDDEPTGQLDQAGGEEVMALLRELNESGRTVVFATHREEIAAHAHRIVELRDGRVVSDRPTGERQQLRSARLRAV
ncbi:ABC transporter ATP-binding protein [Pseudonocardia sp.]|jgi:putative ABC transport system ATP-binding protein|uniref:ABC transporter ATP-binding protein n=1 Tax=Pseudonocardia sp. TaxID=60912 RepID=UPI002F41983B